MEAELMGQDNQTPRDNQQIADDNQQSGVVSEQDMPNQVANKEPAEGSRENAGGISNRELPEEQENQERVPPRGDRKDRAHA
jgi:hypothetical protein